LQQDKLASWGNSRAWDNCQNQAHKYSWESRSASVPRNPPKPRRSMWASGKSIKSAPASPPRHPQHPTQKWRVLLPQRPPQTVNDSGPVSAQHKPPRPTPYSRRAVKNRLSIPMGSSLLKRPICWGSCRVRLQRGDQRGYWDLKKTNQYPKSKRPR
jgi:hypothetical protein